MKISVALFSPDANNYTSWKIMQLNWYSNWYSNVSLKRKLLRLQVFHRNYAHYSCVYQNVTVIPFCKCEYTKIIYLNCG